jgi:branched-chain amino acid transport system substrate-binding protein
LYGTASPRAVAQTPSKSAVLGGIKLALAKYPTLAGKKVEIIYEDDACTPPKAAAAANKLIDIDKVQVLINGVCSGSMLAVAPIAEAHKVILFTPISNSPKVSDAGDYIFRTSASAVRIGQTVSRGVSALGYKKVAVLYENAAFPVDWQTTFSDTYTGAGNTITTKESFESKTTDLRTQLLKIARTKPQAVVIVANSSVTSNLALKQMRELKINLPVIGNEYFSVKPVVQNPDAEGVITVTYKYDAGAPAFKELIAQYEKGYGTILGEDIYIALAYDGFDVLAQAISACNGTDPECIKSELYKMKDFPGVSGNITIDEKGDTAREFVLKRVTGGKMVEIR